MYMSVTLTDAVDTYQIKSLFGRHHSQKYCRAVVFPSMNMYLVGSHSTLKLPSESEQKILLYTSSIKYTYSSNHRCRQSGGSNLLLRLLYGLAATDETWVRCVYVIGLHTYYHQTDKVSMQGHNNEVNGLFRSHMLITIAKNRYSLRSVNGLDRKSVV